MNTLTGVGLIKYNMVLQSYDGNHTPSANVIGCSVKGPDKSIDQVCEDAHKVRTLPDRRYIIAAADGLGSAKRAEKGATLATKEVVKFLKRNLRGGSNLTQSYFEEIIHEAFVKVREELEFEADSREISISDLNTTLAVAIGGRNGVGGAAVGDGSIVYYKQGNYNMLIPAENTEYSEETIPIQSDNWKQSYRIGWKSDVPAVAAFTDGLDNVAFEKKGIPSKTLFQQFFQNIYDFTDLTKLETEVEGFLTEGTIKESSGDDKTIVVGSLPKSDWPRSPSESISNLQKSETHPGRDSDNKTKRNQEQSPDSPAVGDPNYQSDTVVEIETKADETMQNIRDQYSNKTETQNNQPPSTQSKPPTNQTDPSSQDEHVTINSVLGVEEEDLPVSVRIGSTAVFVHNKLQTLNNALLLSTGSQDTRHILTPNLDLRKDNYLTRVEWLINNAPDSDEDTTGSRCLWPLNKVTYNGELIGVEIPAHRRHGSTVNIKRYVSKNRFNLARNCLSELGRRSLARALPLDSRSPQEEVSLELAKLVRDIHQMDCAVGDMSPSQLQVDSRGNILFTRCDKFHVNDDGQYYAGSEPSSRYAPPESNFESIEEIRRADRFGLAVHIFESIIGAHPFGDQEPKQGPWANEENFILNNKRIKETYRIRFKLLPGVYQRMFRRSLLRGLDNPGQRPTAGEWVDRIAER